jgi:hypothetical protein
MQVGILTPSVVPSKKNGGATVKPLSQICDI